MSKEKSTNLEQYVDYVYGHILKEDDIDVEKVRFTVQISKNHALRLEELAKKLRMKRGTLANDIIEVAIGDIEDRLGIDIVNDKEYAMNTIINPLTGKLLTEEEYYAFAPNPEKRAEEVEEVNE